MVEPIEENRPFYINFKNKDKTIYKVKNQILYIFFRDDWGWLNIPEVELSELAKKFKNGEYLK